MTHRFIEVDLQAAPGVAHVRLARPDRLNSLHVPMLQEADGRHITALRYSNDARSPTLYYATGGPIEIRERHVAFLPGNDATLVLSEPLDDEQDDWVAIPESHILSAAGGMVSILPFRL